MSDNAQRGESRVVPDDLINHPEVLQTPFRRRRSRLPRAEKHETRGHDTPRQFFQFTAAVTVCNPQADVTFVELSSTTRRLLQEGDFRQALPDDDRFKAQGRAQKDSTGARGFGRGPSRVAVAGADGRTRPARSISTSIRSCFSAAVRPTSSGSRRRKEAGPIELRALLVRAVRKDTELFRFEPALPSGGAQRCICGAITESTRVEVKTSRTPAFAWDVLN